MEVPYGRLLERGMLGDDVYACKRALKKAGYSKGTQPNRVFGLFMERNVRRFQTEQKIPVDGRIGPRTLSRLSQWFDEYGYYLYTGHRLETLQLPATFTPTHQTGGLPGFPAIDVFADPGTQVLAPADGYIDWPHMIPWSKTARVGGMTCYYQAQGCTYFLTHFGMLNVGGPYKKGDVIGTVGAVPDGWWAPHIHQGRHEGKYDVGV